MNTRDVEISTQIPDRGLAHLVGELAGIWFMQEQERKETVLMAELRKIREQLDGLASSSQGTARTSPRPRRTEAAALMTMADLAAFLGKRRTAAWELSRLPDFPQPRNLGGGHNRVWLRTEVEQWLNNLPAA